MYSLDYPKIILCDNYATLRIFSILTGLIAIKPNNILAIEQLQQAELYVAICF